MPRALTPPVGSPGERFRLVREAARLRQDEFVARLNAAAEQLFGEGGPRFNSPRVSKLETGAQRATLDDVAVYEAVDPLRRGKLWLGWGEEAHAVPRALLEKRAGIDMFAAAGVPKPAPPQRKTAPLAKGGVKKRAGNGKG